MAVRIGISGWTYPPWRQTFFPKGLPHKQELSYASRQVTSIEINGTFYSLQRPSSFARWYEETPPDFVFSVKGSRFITHLKRLKDITTPLANFFASGVLRLEEKLGPFLWQLPPNFAFDAERLAHFFSLLPRTRGEAQALARRHDSRLRTRAWLKYSNDGPLRHALEFRHPTFETAACIELLREHDIAVVVADTAGKWPLVREVTSDFVYCRLHGDTELYASGYDDAALELWAARVRAWNSGQDAEDATHFGKPALRRALGRDVFVYFDNDVKTHAPFDAMRLDEFVTGRVLEKRRAPAPLPAGRVPEIPRPAGADPRWRLEPKPAVTKPQRSRKPAAR
jgi:uncharacterized protein YecE (DUF72 family)